MELAVYLAALNTNAQLPVLDQLQGHVLEEELSSRAVNHITKQLIALICEKQLE